MPNTTFLNTELARLQTSRPFGEYIDALTDALTDKIFNIARSDTVEQFPCRLCAGAGFLVQNGPACRVLADGALEPITLPSGSTVTISTSHHCPRCMGMQFDIEDLAKAYGKQVAA